MSFKEALQQQVLIADGAMGTLLYSQYGVKSAFEGLNLTHGGDILKIHQAYIAAGADVIQTNTYAANRIKLNRYGLADKTKAINEAAVSLAHTAQIAAEHPVYVLGTIGGIAGVTDTEIEPLTAEEIDAGVQEQATCLLQTQAIDGLLLETYYDINELKRALKIVRTLTDLPVVANVTMYEPGVLQDGTPLNTALQDLAALGADVVGANCRLGPYNMSRAFESVALPKTAALAIYPNAGLPDVQDGKTVYDSPAEYFENYSDPFRQQGAHLIGGCCGTTPAHIKGLVAGLQSRQPVTTKKVTLPAAEAVPTAADPRQHDFLQRVQHEKVALVELDPPKTFTTAKFFRGAQALGQAGAGAITLSDGPLANPTISNVALAAQLKYQYGITPLVHLTTRDHNLIGLQSEIMGLHTLGIANILVITGDPAKVGDLPGATSVYDLHSVELMQMIKKFNAGISPTGRNLQEKTNFAVGGAFNPNVRNVERACKMITRKTAYGADFIITQPIFDVTKVHELRLALDEQGITTPIFVGFMPLLSFRNANFLHHEVPGIRLADDTLVRMQQAETDGNEREVGLQIAKETIDAICADFNGVHINTPLRHHEISLELLNYVQAKNAVSV